MTNLINLKKKLNHWVVLALDVLTSMCATVLSLVFARVVFIHAHVPLRPFAWWVLVSALISALSFIALKTYRDVIRYTNLGTMARMVSAVLLKGAFLGIAACFIDSSFIEVTGAVCMILADVLLSFATLLIVRVLMMLVYNFIIEHNEQRRQLNRILIYGTGDSSVSMSTRLYQSKQFSVAGFITYGQITMSDMIKSLPIKHFRDAEDIRRLKRTLDLDAVLFSSESAARDEEGRLIKYCVSCGLRILVMPPMDEVVGGKIHTPIREIKIEDLLGREEIKINIDSIQKNFSDKVVLVTGAAGSIGSELCRQLAGFGVRKLILFDNAETPMHYLRLELEDRFPALDFVPVIGDVRLVASLDYVFRCWHPDIVFHAAAYKHVPLMEENPCEAVLVNVAGTRKVADKCVEYGVDMMVMISTDKAVNPTSIMGCTKRLAEIYIQSLGLAIKGGKHQGHTKFVTTRFGNVLGSNGSVIPRFREQIANGGPVTVTHPEITRFFMTIPEACRLVMEAATMSDGNQIFVFDMGESVKITDLAKRMIELSGLVLDRDIKIEYTGLRPGEKLYEEVLSTAENTIPTGHDRIHIAKVREYDYTDGEHAASSLELLSRDVQIAEMVRLMKHLVPEFKSQNSIFEEYDRELECMAEEGE